jgi:hypothetical protein
MSVVRSVVSFVLLPTVFPARTESTGTLHLSGNWLSDAFVSSSDIASFMT